MSFKPMLASHAELDKIKFPVFVSPKLDGVRAVVIDGVVYSRSLKPIPNKFVQALFGSKEYNGLDGELIVGSPTDPHCFSNTTSGVMSKEGDPKVNYYVFDNFTCPLLSWFDRFKGTPKHDCIKIVPQYHCINLDEVLEKEQEFLLQGYEGAIIRDPNSPYKFGRSTVKEGYLLKLKRYYDSEAVVIGVDVLLSNTNEAKVNELGKLERSNHKSGMVEQPMIGAIRVRDLKTEQVFNIGSGFSEQQRREFYEDPDKILGKIVKYKYFPVGVKELPRHPVFLGIRDEKDL